MISFLKVSAGTVFLLSIVLVPVLLFSGLFLFLAQENSDAKKDAGAYVEMISYERDQENASAWLVLEDVLLRCSDNAELCALIKQVPSCAARSDRFVLVKGERPTRVYQGCLGYDKLAAILADPAANPG